MNVSNIAYSTVNIIVKEVFESYNKGINFASGKIAAILRDVGMDEEKIKELLEVMVKEDPFVKAKKQLEMETPRIGFLKTNFPCADPVTVRLNNIDAKDSYQYVDVKQSLKILLEDETFIKQKNEDPYIYQEGLVQDVRDGESYRSNKFFQDNPEAVPLILFQDELEVIYSLFSFCFFKDVFE